MSEKAEIPYYPRENIQPPGLLKQYGYLNHQDSLEALKVASISQGARYLAEGILTQGGVTQFPGGPGLRYDTVFKRVYDTKLARPAIEETARNIHGLTDAIALPERAGIIPGAQVAWVNNLPVLYVAKNGVQSTNDVSAQVDSYTGGGRDLLQVPFDHIAALCRKTNGITRIWTHDEMIDTGALVMAFADMVGQMEKAGFSVQLTGAGALIEKTYTRATVKIAQQLGIATFSVLQIEDLGLQPFSWIKIKGIERALTFSQENLQ